MVIAVPIGLVAGYYRGWVDTVIARLTDVLLAFPFLILAVGLAAILGPSLLNATIALGVAAMPGLIRITRGETLALREEDFVPAAVANGANDATIIFRHILPNMTSTLLVQATVTIPAAIIGEAVLSFLGLGVQPPTPSWGTMLQDAQSYLAQAPRLAVYPGPRDRDRRARLQRARRRAARHLRSADDALMAAPLLDVTDLSVRFETDDGPVHAVDKLSFTLGPGRGARHRRRVGLRQERDVHVARAAPARDGGDQRQRRCSTAPTCSRSRRGACVRCGDARSRSSSRSR